MFTMLMLVAALCGSLVASDSAIASSAVQVDIGPNVDVMLRDLAEQIGVGAEAVYPLYLRQAAVFADVCVMILIIGGILLAILITVSILLERFSGDDDGMLPGGGGRFLADYSRHRVYGGCFRLCHGTEQPRTMGNPAHCPRCRRICAVTIQLLAAALLPC